MSENQNRGSKDFARYDSMTTEELEEILRLDAQALGEQESDTDKILYVMEVLAERKRNTGHTGKTAQQAWESFQQHYLPDEGDCLIYTNEERSPTKAATPWLRRLTAAAAAILLVVGLSVTAKAFSWTDLWNIVAKWAKETFSFVAEENSQNTEPAAENIQQYTSLQDLLEKTNRETDLVPTWIPDGYELVDIRLEETPVRKDYSAFYRNGEKKIRIGVQSYMDTDPEKVEIHGDIIETYEYSGVEYYVFANMDQRKAVWIRDSYECHISGDLTVEEIKQMIDSIGKG